ncbi:hypothetical protein ABBQ38_005236 [Trebouxia sp. C0009 RCD-2024]
MTHHELYTQCAKVLSLTDCDNLLLVQVDEGNEVDCEYAEDHDPVLERHNLPSVYITSRHLFSLIADKRGIARPPAHIQQVQGRCFDGRHWNLAVTVSCVGHTRRHAADCIPPIDRGFATQTWPM